MESKQPQNFERAVGVVESMYQCVSGQCGQYFRAVGATNCPHCKGERIRELKPKGQAQEQTFGNPRRI